MSSQSQVTTCNLALLSIGARAQVSSISPSDGSTAADACATLFTFVFEQLARTAQWGCLKKQATATLLQAAQATPENPTGTSLPIPQEPWLYAYLYPSDCLYLRDVLCPALPSQTGSIPQTTIANGITPAIPGDGQIPFEIGYTTDSNNNPIQVILTNQEQAVINYTVNQPNPQSWDSLLTSAFVASLAVYLAPALNLNTPLMQSCMQTAERIIQQARAQDGNENPITQDHFPDWLRARQGATGVLLWAGRGYQAYGTMSWPC